MCMNVSYASLSGCTSRRASCMYVTCLRVNIGGMVGIVVCDIVYVCMHNTLKARTQSEMISWGLLYVWLLLTPNSNLPSFHIKSRPWSTPLTNNQHKHQPFASRQKLNFLLLLWKVRKRSKNKSKVRKATFKWLEKPIQMYSFIWWETHRIPFALRS